MLKSKRILWVTALVGLGLVTWFVLSSQYEITLSNQSGNGQAVILLDGWRSTCLDDEIERGIRERHFRGIPLSHIHGHPRIRGVRSRNPDERVTDIQRGHAAAPSGQLDRQVPGAGRHLEHLATGTRALGDESGRLRVSSGCRGRDCIVAA